jgi:hypothetical protein
MLAVCCCVSFFCEKAHIFQFLSAASESLRPIIYFRVVGGDISVDSDGGMVVGLCQERWCWWT